MKYDLAIFGLDTALVDTLAILAAVLSEISGWRESFHPADLCQLPGGSFDHRPALTPDLLKALKHAVALPIASVSAGWRRGVD